MTASLPPADQSDFMECYRGRQTALHHASYMRMSKVLFALHLCKQNGIDLANRDIFDYGFGAGTFFRYCPRNAQLFGVEVDAENVRAVEAMLQNRGYQSVDLRQIEIERWTAHPLLRRKYDVILCSHVLEHLPDPPEFLKLLGRCLRPGGVFIGLVPINERRLDPHHVEPVDRRRVQSWVAAAGLELHTYTEEDTWCYWAQPFFASTSKPVRAAARALSLSLGLPAMWFGPQKWFRLSRVFGMITKSKPTQAGFILAPSRPQTGSATETSVQ